MIQVTKAPGQRSIVVNASLDDVDGAVESAMEFVVENGAPAEKLFDVRLLIHEGLVNAVVHGCGTIPDKHVTLTLSATGDDLIINVRDEGPGFDWSKKTSRIPPTDATCGRGLVIISMYADSYAFNDKGNDLTIVKRLGNSTDGPGAAPMAGQASDRE